MKPPMKTLPIDVEADLQKPKRGRPPKTTMPIKIEGGYLQPGEVPPASGQVQQIPNDGYKILSEDVVSGSGMCECVCCEMCGGKINTKKLKNIPTALSTGASKINPMTYAIKDKKTREAMIASGDVTQDYIQPAVVSAGLPLYYGSAGTAGMMLGGPMGAIAATKGADLLYNKMVTGPGYDPRERQKSELLGNLSSAVGQVGASHMKATIGPSKTKPKTETKPKTGKGIGRVM
jgi:hypothetical protein